MRTDDDLEAYLCRPRKTRHLSRKEIESVSGMLAEACADES